MPKIKTLTTDLLKKIREQKVSRNLSFLIIIFVLLMPISSTINISDDFLSTLKVYQATKILAFLLVLSIYFQLTQDKKKDTINSAYLLTFVLPPLLFWIGLLLMNTPLIIEILFSTELLITEALSKTGIFLTSALNMLKIDTLLKIAAPIVGFILYIKKRLTNTWWQLLIAWIVQSDVILILAFLLAR